MSVQSKGLNFGLNYKQNYDFKFGIQNNTWRKTFISKPFINKGVANKPIRL